MEFRRLISAQDPLFAEAFALYEASFPGHEQRAPDKQAAVMPNPLYHFNVIMEGGAFAGILLHWEGSGYVYIEHFAVSPALRGNAIGSRALEAFCEGHPSVILEIDPPVDDISVRREHFYHRLGFKTNSHEHIHPSYQKKFAPHRLVLMSCPERITESGCRLFQRELKEIMLKDVSG